MTFTREQKQSAYKKLPPETQNLIMSNETTELISATLKEAGLNEEQENLADSEILYAMFCLQSLDDAINNIAKLSNKNPDDLSKIRSAVQNNILNKYKIGIKDFINTNKNTKTPVPDTKAPAIPPTNLPMVEKGEVVHEVPHVETPNPSISLGASNQSKVSLPDYRYPGGQDPYREPTK